MQIHELNNFSGAPGNTNYLAIDDGTDTGRISGTDLLAPVNARIDNIVSGVTVDSEVIDGRLGADGVTYGSLGTAIRTQVTDLKTDIDEVADFLGFNFGEEEASVDGYNSSNSSNTNNANSPFIYHSSTYDYAGKVITKIKLNADRTGVISIGVIKKNKAVSGQSANVNDAIIKANAVVAATGTQTIELRTPFTVESDEYVFIGLPTSTATWKYGGYGTDKGFLYKSGSNWAYSSSSVGVTIYTAPQNLAEYSTIVSEVANNAKDIGSIKPIMELIKRTDEIKSYDSYNAANVTEGNFYNAPFVIAKYGTSAFNVVSFDMNVRGAGTVTIGKIKKSDVGINVAYDQSKLMFHETITLTTTGFQNIKLSTPMMVGSDEYVFYGFTSDTATHYYGSAHEGQEAGFYYLSNGVGPYAYSGGSANINLYSVVEDLKSTYDGKTLSILGDSISTFSGYIPSGNETYYPSGTVQAVSDTWWYKLYTALGMTLNTNNSWSGSRVTTTNGSTSAGCGDRAETLGTSPDVIIVWMGINDFNNEVALGTYDGTTALPNTTTTFREAYAIMLNKILAKYQTSEVWVCTLPQCERNAESGFPEINGNGVALVEFNKAILELANAFGVKVLDHNKSGLTYQNMPTYNPDNLHPNKDGHSLIANNDIRQMDNTIRTRY